MTPPVRSRDLHDEASLIEQAAWFPRVDFYQLVAVCRERANELSGEYVIDPLTVRLDKDRVLEAQEEVVDAVNNTVWWLQDHPDGHDARFLLYGVLQHMVQAYDLLAQAHRLTEDA